MCGTANGHAERRSVHAWGGAAVRTDQVRALRGLVRVRCVPPGERSVGTDGGTGCVGVLFVSLCERPPEEAEESCPDTECAGACCRFRPPQHSTGDADEPRHQDEGRDHGGGASGGEGLPAKTAFRVVKQAVIEAHERIP
jgi:hypothetical protein